MIRLLATILFLLSFLPAFTQTGSSYIIQHFTTDNGLPANGIKGLQWDEETDFLWIATEAGVARFNGIDFKNFTHQNTPTITSERMMFMIRNNAGKIYTVDLESNIHYVSRNHIRFYEKLHSLAPVYYDNRFTLSISDAFYHSSKDFKSTATISFLNSRFVPMSDTSCVILHAGYMFWYAKGDTVHDYLEDGVQIRAIFKIGDRPIYTTSGLRFFQMNKDAKKNVELSYSGADIKVDKLLAPTARVIWVNGMKNPIVINGNNAWKLTFRDEKITPELICDVVPTDAFISYAQYNEKQKTLALGTESKGILIINEEKVTPMKSVNQAPNERNSYYSQMELPDGNVLTGEGTIVGHAKGISTVRPVKGKFSNHLSYTGDSLLWYSQYVDARLSSRLFKHNFKTKQTTLYDKIKGNEIIIHPLPGGQYLLVSESGIGKLSHDSVEYIYRHPAEGYQHTIGTIAEVDPGRFLIASCSGILQYDLAHPTKLDTILKSEGHCIRSIWKYGPYFFFGSYGRGFFVWKDGVLKSMPLDKKKYLLYTHCFIPDSFGYCWISTNRGLFKASLEELINTYEKDKTEMYYHYFGKKDGLEILEMNGGCTPCAIELKNRTLSFPTMDGLLWVDPSKAVPTLPDGQIFIDEIIADSMVVDPEEASPIVFPAKTESIMIKLSFSAWCNKENIYVDYQLNDSLNWKPLDTDKEVNLQFNNLGPGQYTLRFRKLNGFGINNYTYKTLEFRIVKPWHQQWWFSMLAALSIAALVAAYLHFRTRQFKIRQRKLEQQVAEKTKELQEQNEVLEKNNSIKTRLISIISHDIVTPLKFLTVAGKNLLEKKQLMSEELQKETINEITNTSQELQLLSTNILNWIKYQNENRRLTREVFNLYEMVQQVLGILNSLAQQKNLQIINEIDPNAEVYQYYEPLKILIYNLLTNSIHFSEKGSIRVFMGRESNQVVVSVKDEGVGMTPEKVQSLMADHVVISSANVDNKKGHGLGFLIIKDLLKTMGASIRIVSKIGEGSTISILFPLTVRGNEEMKG